MQTLLEIVAVWFALNLAVPAFIFWQRSPHFRHRVWQLVNGTDDEPANRRNTIYGPTTRS